MSIKALIFILTTCLLSGCRRESSVSTDTGSFQLSVIEILSNTDNKISILSIRAVQDSCLSIEGEGFQSQVGLPDAKGFEPRDGSVLLSATRIAPTQSSQAYIQTLIDSLVQSGKVGGPIIHTVSTNTSLATFFSICATNGIYKLDSPVTIALIEGKPVTLVVGKPTMKWPYQSPEPTNAGAFHLITTNGLTMPPLGGGSTLGR
jgi:hypothetical protein